MLSLPPFLPQVKELSSESIRLTTTYPGANAAVISTSMEPVHAAWESLQMASSGRKKKLRAALDLQKLLSSVRIHKFCVHMYVRTYLSVIEVKRILI